MRLWSIHPKYLDSKGLVALWREWLLAKKSLEWKTIWYTKHPQLNRFKASPDPISCISAFLKEVFEESKRRWYKFDWTKIADLSCKNKINVTIWQLDFEKRHLESKLLKRCPEKLMELKSIKNLDPNPIFEVVSWGIENWEK